MNCAHVFVTVVIAGLIMGCQARVEKPNMTEPKAEISAPASSTSQTPMPSPSVTSSAVPVASAAAPATHDVSAGSTSYAEKLGQDGVMDWTAGVVTATGIGYPPPDTVNSMQARLLAKRAAQSVAYRNLLEATKAIRVDSTTTVNNYTTTSDVIQTKVTGWVEDAKIVRERDLENRGYEVTVQMQLTGQTSQLFVPKDAPPLRPLVFPKSPSAQPKPIAPYTGLVVDARGMDVRPALMPRILTEDGQEAYSQSYVLAKYRQKEGIAAYVSDPTAAQSHPKVTDHPLLVKALRAAGNSRTDLVISNAAAQTIHGVTDHLKFLEKGQVILIIDRSGTDALMR